MSNENKQPDERAESDMRAAFAQHMGQPWEAALEAALEAARRIWSLAWGASRFYERQAQPDERATFTDLAHEVWSAAQLPPGEGIADGVARIEAILARATQQATKGDERAALDVEILSGPCVNVCVTQDSKPKDQRFDVVVIRKTDFDKLTSARTTPSPVAGSAGQAPIYLVRDDVRTWREVDADMFERAPHEDRRIVYAAPTAPSLTPERKTSNPHKGGTEAYLATEHFNEGWNACLDARAPSLTTDAGAVLTQAQRAAIQNALRWIPRHLEPEMHDALGELLAAQPTEQRMSDAERDVITVWSDGTWKCWRAGDAAYAADDPDWLLNIPLDAARKAEIERSGGEAC